MRYELSDYEWSVIRPMLPNKPRGDPRVDDRRILDGIFWVLRGVVAANSIRRRLWVPALASLDRDDKLRGVLRR